MSALARLRQFHSQLKYMSGLERGHPVPLGLPGRLRAWRHGFRSESYLLFDLEHRRPEEHISDLLRYKAWRILGPYRELLNDKVVFELAMCRYLKVPRNFALIAQGRILPLREDVHLADVPSLIHVAIQDQVVLKPVRGNKGVGILFLRVEDGVLLLNGERVSRSELEATVAGLNNYVITEFVHQGNYVSDVFPGATSSIRMVTMVEPGTREPFIPVAVHRIATNKSAPVDNFSQGSVSVAIDLDTGRLGRAAARLGDGKVTWHDRHPDTGVAIAGIVVPHWQLVKERMLRAVRMMPYLTYVGWDIVVTEDGFTVLEGNNMPGVDVLQVHGPLLRDPRVRRFFEHHGLA